MRALVAGIGNIFLADDGFGVEVARRLAARALPAGVTVKDFGLRGFDLACALTDSWDLVILVDAAGRGGAPGSIYVIEPDLHSGKPSAAAAAEPHGLNPMHAIELAKSLGGISARLLLVGCEPAGFETEGETLALSAPVQAAVEATMDTIEHLLSDFRQGQHCFQSIFGGVA